MGEEKQNPNQMYLVPDVLEEILLLLPLKSILKFKIVSKEWKSILESRSFTERRFKIKKKQRAILAVGDRTKSRFQEEEMCMFYIHWEAAATRPLLTCDGLVCIPVPGWVKVFNPSTGESLSFPSGPDPGTNPYGRFELFSGTWWDPFPGFWKMGFGMDKVSGGYKVVRMFFDPIRCEILDVNIGEWRNLSPPPYRMYLGSKSACVNGSIYWLELKSGMLLALNLHTEEFLRCVPFPSIYSEDEQIVNLEGRLALARLDMSPDCKLEILILDAQEKTWTLTYSIQLFKLRPVWALWIRPVAISERGNLYLHDSENRLLKYYPETDLLQCLSSNICVISPFIENLVPLRPSSVSKTSMYQSGFHCLENKPSSQISKFFRWTKLHIPNILLTTSLVSLIMFRCLVVSSRS